MDKLVSLLLRFSGTGFTLLTTIVLTRKWNLEATGAFFIYYSLYRVLAGIVSSVFVRKTIRDLAKTESKDWNNLAHKIFNEKVSLGLLLMSIAWIGSMILYHFGILNLVTPGVIISTLLWTIIMFINAVIQGVFKSNLSIIIEFVCVPIAFLAGLLITPATASPVLVHTVALIVTSMVSIAIIFRYIIPSKLNLQLPKFEKEDYTFIGVRSVNVIQSNVIMLLSPLVLSKSEIGLIGVTLRFFNVSNAILTGLSSHYSPRFSKAYYQTNFKKMSRLFRESQVISTLSYLPLMFVYVFFGDYVARFMNLEGQIENLLIGVGLIGLINVFTNLSGYMLLVSSRQKYVLRANVISLVILLVVYLPLANLFSLSGFLFAFGLYQMFKQGILYAEAKKLLLSMKAKSNTQLYN